MTTFLRSAKSLSPKAMVTQALILLVFFTTFKASAQVGSVNFQSQQKFNTGKSPISPVIVDIDGDGKNDIVVANFNALSISVYFNTSAPGIGFGAASFAERVDFPTAGSPVFLAVGDLNNDGRPDIVVANASASELTVFRNTATAGAISSSSLVRETSLPSDIGMRSLAIADFDGDGKNDLAAVSPGTSQLSIYKNASTTGGTISLSKVFTVATGASPFGVVAADFNGDGKPDVAVANRGDNNVSVYLNYSSGSLMAFAGSVNFSAGGIAPQALAAADFDGDGFPDLAVLTQTSAHICILRNNGMANFTAIVNLPVGTSPSALAVGDLDSDGRPDLLATNFGSDNISILLNNGTGTTISFTTKNDFPTGNNPWGASIGDVDGNGSPDIAVANYSDGTDERTISVLRSSDSAPTVQASNVRFSNTTNSTTTVSWTNGNGSKRVVFMRSLNAFAYPSPADNTSYTADASYSRGSDVGGWYCVYNGTGSSVDVTGLGANQTYRTMVLEYNDIPGQEKYSTNTATGNPVAVTSSNTLITFTPKSGEAGSTVTINGSDFSTNLSFNTVYFGTAKAKVTAATKTNLTVTVPKGSTHQPINVIRTNGTQAFSHSPFAVTRADGKIGLQPANTFTTGSSNARKTAVGDMDGDGKPDLIVTNGLGIAVLKNTTPDNANNSIFATPIIFATGGVTPTHLAVADMNGDGKLDVVVGDAGAAKISIFVNISSVGTPDFAKLDISIATSINNMVVADFNMDGKPDIAIVPSNGDRVAIYSNTTSGYSLNFSSSPLATISLGVLINSIVATDLNGDGKPDIAVINNANARLYLIQNTGTTAFSFTTQPYIATSPNPKQLAVADMDGDGTNDLVVIGTHTIVHRNISTSNTIEFNYAYLLTDNVPESLAINDMDGDGKPDIVITGSKSLAIIRNSLTSASFPRTNGVTPDLVESRFYFAPTNGGVALADFDGDGKPDVAVTNNASTGSVMVYKNTLVPTLTSVSPIKGPAGTVVTLTGTNFNTGPNNNVVFFGTVKGNVTAATPTSVTVTAPASGSFKNISLTDLSTGIGRTANTPFAVTYPNGLINFVPQQKFSTGMRPISPVIADFDGDGKPDLVVANFAANTISVFRNTSATGSINASSFTDKADFTTGTSPVNIAVGDLNGDGKPDIAVVNAGSNSFSVFINNSSAGTIGFATKVDITTLHPNIRAIAIADFDGDGLNDVVTSSSSNNTLLTYRNVSSLNGAFNAVPAQGITVSATPYSIVVQDFNGDGKPDIAVAHYGSNVISVIQNQSEIGTFSLSSRIDFVSGSSAPAKIAAIVAADFDGDGKPDLAALNQADNTISVFRNNISPGALIDASSFANKVDFTTGVNPSALTVGDLDGDGKPELVTSNYGGNSASILRNTSSSGSIDAGSFATKVDLPTGDTPWGVAVADLDGDGRQDIVVANYADNTDERTISVFRNGIAPPTTQATSLFFYNTSTNSASLVWIRGNGSRRAVFMLEGNSGTPAPVVNTAYTASATFGNGTQIGTSGWYCIYNGTNNTLTATNLKPGTTYRVMVVEYNSNSGGYEQYLTEPTQVNPTNVTTLASSDATLSSLTLSSGTLSPVFAAESETYSATVDNASTSITVTPTVNEVNATVQMRINGAAYASVTSGNESPSFSLNVGTNTIEVKVTAQDGTTTKTYTVTVTRAGSANADLASLSITEGALSPVFAAGTTTYTATVTATSLKVMATVAQSDATITVNGSPVTSGNASGSITLSAGLNTITVIITAQDGTTTKTYTLNITQEAVLPVSLISFTAKADRNYTLLNWVTADEDRNKGFEVWRAESSKQKTERPEDVAFVKIGEVKASLASDAKPQIYSFTDKQPVNGTNYYKLIQIDNDGKTKELGIRTVNFSFPTSDIQLYPNPTDDLVTLSFSAATFNQLQVIDLNGRILQKIGIGDRENTKVISLSSYQAGIYVVKFIGSETVELRKLIRR